MSLLNQNPAEESDDAARGEDLTKGTSRVMLAAILAAVAVSVAIGVYFYAHRPQPMAEANLLEFWAHPMITVTPGFDASGAPMQKNRIDHALLFAHVRLRNVSGKPLFLDHIAFNVALDDGIHSSYAASKLDYERVFTAYPELAAFRREGMQTNATLEPGQTIEGQFAANIRLDRLQWQARKAVDVAFHFRYQPEVVLAVDSARIVEH